MKQHGMINGYNINNKAIVMCNDNNTSTLKSVISYKITGITNCKWQEC